MSNFKKILILLIFLTSPLAGDPSRIAILFGPEEYNQWSQDFATHFIDSIQAETSSPIEYYIHYLGIGVDDPYNSPYFDSAINMLSKRKYNIVVSMFANAGKFVQSQSHSLFLNSARIYVLPDQSLVSSAQAQPNSYFVKSASSQAIANTLELIPKLFPTTEEIIFVSGLSSTDSYYMNIARSLTKDSSLKTLFLQGLPIADIIRLYKNPSSKEVLFFLSYEKDRKGQSYLSSHIAEEICKNVNLPVFGFIETLIGSGFFGGSVTSAAFYAEDAASQALNILKLKKDQNLNEKILNTRYVFEWPQLKRFKIPESRLPANSIVKYKVISDFEKNIHYYIGASILLIVQLSFIIYLLLNRLKLKTTQANLQKERDYIKKINETSPIGITVADRNGQITYANHEAESILDLNRSTIQKRKYDDPLWKITAIDGSPFNEKQLPFYKVKTEMRAVYDICHAIAYDNGNVKLLSINASPILNEKKEFNGMLAVIQDITEATRIKKDIEKSLKEKETLLQELYHRTKNNMQVICSMLNLQRKFTTNKEVQEQLQEAENRINSMALVHQKLYQSKSLSIIYIKEYMEDLISLIRESYQNTSQNIQFDIFIEDFQIVIDIAIPLGLIINELLSNTFKHAFPDHQGKVTINLEYKNQKDIFILVKDNGIGVPKNFNFFNSNTLGIQTIISIIETQLGGDIKFESNNGLSCAIHFENIIYHTRV